MTTDKPLEYDYAIIGSGFGGSVSAMRLAEKGYKVVVLERGKRYGARDFPKTNWRITKYLWIPFLRCFGIQEMSLFKNVLILGGSGVGGGSLVYANTLLQPDDKFYAAPIWKNLADWKSELAPHYATAKRMLGVTTNPSLTFIDHSLKDVARELGREATFEPTEVGVYFGTPGKTVPDPYFGGKGPERTGCLLCGGCMVGCRHGAKNTLDKNYLYFAEKAGALVMPETRVTDVRPVGGGRGEKGWELQLERTTAWLFKDAGTLRARRVVFSAGVLGTVRLLLRCKHITKSLPALSDRLGEEVRTNSEALLGLTLLNPPPERDCSRGVAISSIFHPDDHTHIQPVRYPSGSSFMRTLAAPMADGTRVAWHRPFRMVLAALLSPVDTLRLLLNRRWAESTIILLVMQTLDNKMRLTLGRNLFTFFRRGMTTDLGKGAEPIPTYIPVGHQIARRLAAMLGGVPQSTINEVVLNIPTTAHVLGGCPIGGDPSTGVIDKDHRVFGYEGLTVCDGSAIPANLGVNPSLTITAMTERAMSKVPTKS